MLSIAEAIHASLPHFTPRPAERVALPASLGRFLATALHARVDLPPFANSAMDGYAVRAAEVAGASSETPVAIPLEGESRAGSAPGVLAEGRAMRIFTGAPLPEGADAVVMQEDTDRDGDLVRVRLAVPRGHHVRRRAEDARAGDLLLAAGALVGPGEIALAASQGHGHVSVHRRPRVAILSTGDELREVGEPLEPGTIVNTNAWSVAAQVELAGGVPWVLPTARDEASEIRARLEEALSADVVVTTGGVSVGDHDHVAEAFDAIGVRTLFWKVKVKPGKPVRFGLFGDVPVVGLPGNPASSLVTFELFVRPGLRAMLGDPRPHALWLDATLAAPHRRKGGRPELARARLVREDGGLRVHLLGLQGSGSLPSMAGADALVLLPADASDLQAGDAVAALPIGWLRADTSHFALPGGEGFDGDGG